MAKVESPGAIAGCWSGDWSKVPEAEEGASAAAMVTVVFIAEVSSEHPLRALSSCAVMTGQPVVQEVTPWLTLGRWCLSIYLAVWKVEARASHMLGKPSAIFKTSTCAYSVGLLWSGF